MSAAPRSTTDTPATLGYRMPAEWEPHAATWLSWPHNEPSWPGKLAAIPPIFAKMVAALTPGEEVHILVDDEAAEACCRPQLQQAGAAMSRVFFHGVPTNDSWMRDSGPTFVTRAAGDAVETAVINWGFNTWGAKYPPWDLDDEVPVRIAELLGLPVFEPGMILEGGSIDVNGRGALLTTESCLLNPNRNPRLTREQIEARLRSHLGVRHILWLREGIAGDDTDGHIDDLTRFVDATTVVTVVSNDPKDDDYGPLQANYRRLQEMTDQDGQPLRILTLPTPEPIFHQGQRLPASYANFYIGNAAVLVPSFAQATDAAALATLRPLFPQRRVIGIDAVDLVWGLGAFHCVTQQQPAATR